MDGSSNRNQRLDQKSNRDNGKDDVSVARRVALRSEQEDICQRFASLLQSDRLCDEERDALLRELLVLVCCECVEGRDD